MTVSWSFGPSGALQAMQDATRTRTARVTRRVRAGACAALSATAADCQRALLPLPPMLLSSSPLFLLLLFLLLLLLLRMTCCAAWLGVQTRLCERAALEAVLSLSWHSRRSQQQLRSPRARVRVVHLSVH